MVSTAKRVVSNPLRESLHLIQRYLRIACPNCHTIIHIDNIEQEVEIHCPQCATAFKKEKGRFSANVIIGDYVILSELGRGTTGVGVLAFQMSLKRKVVLKLIRRETINDDLSLSDRLLEEAQMVASMGHPNILQCFAFGMDADVCYYAMEYVEGGNLRKRLADSRLGGLDVSLALEIIHKLAGALKYAWEKFGLLHQDIKPENILLGEELTVKLGDMGLACPLYKMKQRNSKLELRCSPDYMSPEQLTGNDVDFRSDMFSLGVVLYECLTGKRPFRVKTVESLVAEIISCNPKRLRDELSVFPVELVDFTLKLLEKSPESRFSDYNELLEELNKVKKLFAVHPKEISVGQEKKKASSFPHWLAHILMLIVIVVLGVANFGAEKVGDRSVASGDVKDSGDLKSVPGETITNNDYGSLRIVAILPDPVGFDHNRETVTFENVGESILDLQGWRLTDDITEYHLSGQIKAGDSLVVTLLDTDFILNDRGKTFELRDPFGNVRQVVSYTGDMVKTGELIKIEDGE